MCLMEHQHQCLGVYTLQTFTTERNSLNEPYHDAVKIDGDNLNNNKRYIFIPLSLIHTRAKCIKAMINKILILHNAMLE